MWDFWSLSPESLHQVTILMSDRGLPQSPRFINGYGSHTFSFINAKSERSGSNSTSRPNRESSSTPIARPSKLSARPASHFRKTCSARSSEAKFPSGRCSCKSCLKPTSTSIGTIRSNVTKVWPHDDYPLIEVGVLELNRNPENYFQEIETCRVLAIQHCARVSASPRQDAAGAHLLLCRRAPLPAWHALTKRCR